MRVYDVADRGPRRGPSPAVIIVRSTNELVAGHELTSSFAVVHASGSNVRSGASVNLFRIEWLDLYDEQA